MRIIVGGIEYIGSDRPEAKKDNYPFITKISHTESP